LKRFDGSDAACAVAAAALLTMSALSLLDTNRYGYALWTGVFCSVLCLLPLLFRQARVVRLPLALTLLILVAVFLHGYGVLVMRYDDLPWYDTVTHIVSSMTVALCVLYSLRVVELLDRGTSFSVRWSPLFIILITLTFGVYWEVFELAIDNTWGTNMQYSPWDTIRDMSCNVIGALAIAAASWLGLVGSAGPEFISRLELHPSLVKLASRQWPSGAPPSDQAGDVPPERTD
jgi:hypothetical protein